LTGALLAVEMNRSAYDGAQPVSEKQAELLELAVTAAASLGEYVLAGDQRVGLISNGSDAAERFPDDWKGGIFRRSDEALMETRITMKTETVRPVEVSPGKGRPQLERIHDALARLVTTDHLKLPELLRTELPRLPRTLVLMIVTPSLDRALDETLGELKRSGIETAVIWICDPEERTPPGVTLTQRIPLYPIRGDSDIMGLGARSL
jgi:uncharacterized protein (DUF58 family)